ncbi:hypothetical protein D3C85_1107100 [compost metagenome]
MRGEQVQQGELLVGQGDAVAGAADATLEHVDLQVVDVQVFFFPGRTAPGQGAQACHQFGEGKRLDQVIVGAQFEAFDAVGDVIPGGEEQHRCIGLLAQAAQDFPAIHLRHHDVQHDHIEVVFQGQVQAIDAVPRQVHGVSEFLQAVEQVIAGLGFVFDNEDVHANLPDPVGLQGRANGESVARSAVTTGIRSVLTKATHALDLIVQLVLATLVVEVVELRRNDAALAVEVGHGQDLGNIYRDIKADLVVDDRRGGLGGGKRRTGGEQGGKTRDQHFHDESLSTRAGCLPVVGLTVISG